MNEETHAGQAPEQTGALPGGTMRLWILAALISAAALRLGFTFTTNTPAIYFDSVAYMGVADDMARLARSPGLALDMFSDLSASGKDRKSLKQIAEDRGFSHISHINARLVAYPAFLAAIRFFTHKIIFISIAQALLDSFTCLLVFMLAARMFNAKTGVFASWLYALYPPLAVSPHFVMSETLSAFLIVALLAASHAMIVNGRARHAACAGLLLFLLFACRHAFQLLPLFVFPAYAIILLVRGQSVKSAALALIPAILAFAILALPWMFTLKAVFGQWLAPGQGGLAFFIGQRQETEGWQDDFWFAEIPGWDAETASALPTENEYKRAAFKEIRKRPADFALLFFDKNARMWSRPQNEFSVDFILPARLWRAAHLAVLLFGLAGMIAAIAAFPAAALPAVLILHACLTHGLTIALARYNLPFMPVWIVFAAWGAAAGPGFAAHAIGNARLKIVLAASCVLFALYSLKLNLFALEAPGTAFKALGLLALGGFCVVCLAACSRAANLASARPAWRAASVLFTAAVFACLAAMVLAARDNLSWAHTFRTHNRGIEQVIEPRDLPIGGFRKVTLFVDAQTRPPDLSPLEISFNGTILKRAGEPVRERPRFFGFLSGTYEHYRRVRGLEYTDFRQWFAFPVDAKLMRKRNRIQALCKGGPGHWCRIHGDYYLDKEKKTLYMPRFIFSPFDSSVWKFVDMGDNRLMAAAAPRSRVTRAARLDSRGRDLCSRPGVQRGQYRIRIVAETRSGSRIVM